MAACPEYEVLLDLHATGALETDEAARVSEHVRTCDACREAVASTVKVLTLAELPPLTAQEKAVVQELPQRTLSAWRWESRNRGLGLRTLGALMAVAAAVLVLLVPALFWSSGGEAVPAEPASVAVTGAAGLEETDAETMAAIEAWAGLEPLDVDLDALEGDALADEDPDFEWGETL
ncbi:zf-HC2 domain-containing protein [Pyxidicoccus fallax]|uniref:Zf-HC2 domain-containing protein n=1 Tax=Pyxidicoccus fallax TaxID=394095 RepID=A0A848LS80_9BACT|nr:zf-HC2 domain-containing protein [Pyxidicoccus fallax]NMO20519.1 zf-HC2 domain-containing protein [Pyxidicoccus fallax]NPC83711.1 zf-HC2 domain-containing protein [Pyxidicoccus fallax]